MYSKGKSETRFEHDCCYVSTLCIVCIMSPMPCINPPPPPRLPAELLRRSAEHILTDLTQLLFTRLAEMSEDDHSGSISRVGTTPHTTAGTTGTLRWTLRDTKGHNLTGHGWVLPSAVTQTVWIGRVLRKGLTSRNMGYWWLVLQSSILHYLTARVSIITPAHYVGALREPIPNSD